MKTVNVHAAKTHLSRLLDEAVAGREIVIAKAGTPVVRLVPVARASARTGFGSLKGKLRISPHFDRPLPARLRRAFGARS